MLPLLNTYTKISLNKKQAMFCTSPIHFWVCMKQYQRSVPTSNERHRVHRDPNIQDLIRPHRHLETKLTAHYIMFILEKLRNHHLADFK